MPDACVIEVSGRTAGIVARDPHTHSFNFFAAEPSFNALEGQRFSDPSEAERAARLLAKHGSLPRRLAAGSPACAQRPLRQTPPGCSSPSAVSPDLHKAGKPRRARA